MSNRCKRIRDDAGELFWLPGCYARAHNPAECTCPTILFRGHGGVVPNSVPFTVHYPEACTENEPHEVFYMQLSDCGEHIRKWSRSPFEGARKCRVGTGSTEGEGAAIAQDGAA